MPFQNPLVFQWSFCIIDSIEYNLNVYYTIYSIMFSNIKIFDLNYLFDMIKFEYIYLQYEI